MLEINANNNNAIVRRNGEKLIVIRYDEDYLRIYSKLYLDGWTKEKILKELHYAIKGELLRAFPDEAEEKLDKAALFLLTYAEENVHDPRKTEGVSYKVVYEYANGRKGTCIEGGKVKLFDTEQEAEAFASDLNNCISPAMKHVFPVYRAVKA